MGNSYLQERVFRKGIPLQDTQKFFCGRTTKGVKRRTLFSSKEKKDEENMIFFLSSLWLILLKEVKKIVKKIK